jgi:hypothetical protein
VQSAPVPLEGARRPHKGWIVLTKGLRSLLALQPDEELAAWVDTELGNTRSVRRQS